MIILLTVHTGKKKLLPALLHILITWAYVLSWNVWIVEIIVNVQWIKRLIYICILWVSLLDNRHNCFYSGEVSRNFPRERTNGNKENWKLINEKIDINVENNQEMKEKWDRTYNEKQCIKYNNTERKYKGKC